MINVFLLYDTITGKVLMRSSSIYFLRDITVSEFIENTRCSAGNNVILLTTDMEKELCREKDNGYYLDIVSLKNRIAKQEVWN